MSKQRKFILIAAAVGIISMFLPWMKFSLFGTSSNVSGIKLDYSFIILLCFFGAGIIAFLGNQVENLKPNMWMLSLICGGLALIISVWKYLDIPVGLEAGFGIYLAILSGAAILVSGFMFRSPTDNLKDGFNSLKSDIETRLKSTSTTSTSGTQSSSDKKELNSPK